jgi:hypothetical protein
MVFKPAKRNRYRRSLAPLLLLAFTNSAVAHPDKIEDRLLVHFATGVHPIENHAWPDLTHRFTAAVQGEPKLGNIGPAQALMLNGFTDWLLIAPDRAQAEPGLPVKDFSICEDDVVRYVLSEYVYPLGTTGPTRASATFWIAPVVWIERAQFECDGNQVPPRLPSPRR